MCHWSDKIKELIVQLDNIRNNTKTSRRTEKRKQMRKEVKRKEMKSLK